MTDGIDLRGGWQQRFDDYLDEKAGGKEAWKRLVLGSNMVLLVRLAAQITSDAPCALREQRERLKEFSQNAKRGSTQVLAAAVLIRELSRRLLDYGVNEERFADLPGQLEAYSESLASFGKIAASEGSTRRPKTADFALFFLHVYLTVATGQPQWWGLATLLEAAYAGYGHSVEVDEEALRQKIKRLRARHPRACTDWEQKARNYHASGNGNWPTRKELDQIAEDVATELTNRWENEIPSDAKLLE